MSEARDYQGYMVGEDPNKVLVVSFVVGGKREWCLFRWSEGSDKGKSIARIVDEEMVGLAIHVLSVSKR